MEKPKKNLAESIYSRLKNVAKQRKRPVQEVLKYYAIWSGAFLHAHRFV
jgi:hypothetical protein